MKSMHATRYPSRLMDRKVPLPHSWKYGSDLSRCSEAYPAKSVSTGSYLHSAIMSHSSPYVMGHVESSTAGQIVLAMSTASSGWAESHSFIAAIFVNDGFLAFLLLKYS